MKKGNIAWLIVALALIVVGGGLLALGVSRLSKDSVTDISVSLNNHYTEREEYIRESFSGVLVDTEDCDVVVVSCPETEAPRVVIREREKTPHKITVDNGVLKIKMQDKRTWLDHIGIGWSNMAMMVYLPQKQYASIEITTATGAIEIPETFSASEAKLTSDTGRISCIGNITGLLKGESDTGSVWVHNYGPKQLQLRSDTGDVEVFGISQCDTVTAKSDTGKVMMTDVACKMLDAETATGDMEFIRVIADTQLQLRSDTGNIWLGDSDSIYTTIETQTGDVNGFFLTPKVFETHTATGDVDARSIHDGDLCRVSTATGDIQLKSEDYIE